MKKLFSVPFPLWIVITYYAFLTYFVGPFGSQNQPALLIFLVINTGVMIGLLKQNKFAFVLSLVFLFYVLYKVFNAIIVYGEEILGGPYPVILAINIFCIFYLFYRLKNTANNKGGKT